MKDFFGKLLTGAGIGFLVGGPVGAILGAAFAGSLSAPDDLFGMDATEEQNKVLFISNLTVLMTLVAKADDTIAPEEARAIADFFKQQLNFGEEQLSDIRRLMKETVRANPDPRQVAAEFASVSSPEERLSLLRLIYMVAGADGPVNRREQQVIDTIADALGVGRSNHSSVSSEFSGADDPYAVLGISRDATDDEVKTAYRSRARQYHPDRVSHLGDEFVELANQKFDQIRKAYDRIKKLRGL